MMQCLFETIMQNSVLTNQYVKRSSMENETEWKANQNQYAVNQCVSA